MSLFFILSSSIILSPQILLSHNIVHYFFYVMNHTVQHPLHVDLNFASKGKAVQSLVGSDIGIYGFNNGNALIIAEEPAHVEGVIKCHNLYTYIRLLFIDSLDVTTIIAFWRLNNYIVKLFIHRILF